MTSTQKIIKYLAIALAVFIIVTMAIAALSLLGSIFSFFNSDDKITETIKTSYENVTITELYIDISSSELTIKNGDTLTVETNNEKIKIQQNGQELRIEEKDNFLSFGNKQILSLTVYIPDHIMLDEAQIETGAGKINIDGLNTKDLSLELGAGEALIKNINVTEEASIEGGAGKINVESGTLRNLDFDMGVGEAVFSVALDGENDINSGVGALTIKLQGAKENYKISVNKGIGAAVIDGQNISDGAVIGNGQTSIDIDGGVGAINVEFK